jgi:hypothetical protein
LSTPLRQFGALFELGLSVDMGELDLNPFEGDLYFEFKQQREKSIKHAILVI